MADKDTALRRTRSNPDIERFLSAWQRDPKSRVFAPLAEEYRKIGEVERAIEVCLRGLEVHPNYVSGRVALGRAYFDKGEYESARAQLEMVYEADPENLVAAKTLGEIYEAEGNLDKALLCYRLALYTTPSATEINEKIESVQRQLAQGVAGAAVKAFPGIADQGLTQPVLDKEKSPLEAARAELRKSEALAAGETEEAVEEDREGKEDLREEIERLRRLPERFLVGRDELEVATDEFFLGAEVLRKIVVKIDGERKGELVSQSLTELMLRRGYMQRAVKVYEEFLLSTPSNDQAKQRIMELRKQLMEIEHEIRLREGETGEKVVKDYVDPAVINSLQNWLRTLKQGADYGF